MKTKHIVVFFVAVCLIIGGYFSYRFYYVKTLKLSEIVGSTENDILNVLVNLADFDTGLTRHDIHYLKSNKDYWINRIKEVEAIGDPQQQQQANIKLLSDMMEDPTMKKICKLISVKGLGLAVKILENIL